jgi:hypothetical protein
MRIGSAIALGLLGLLVAGPAAAQQVEIESRPPAPRERAPEIVPPGLHYEISRPDDADFYPYGPKVRHDPAFIEPFVTETEGVETTGRAGLSGWTAPNTPVGPPVGGYRDVNGWLAIGFTISWGGPPPPKRPAR